MELKNMGLIKVDRTMMQYLKLQEEKREKEKREEEQTKPRPLWRNDWRK